MGPIKPKINVTTKGLSRKQVIILMTISNTEIIINSANKQIANINECLKDIKLNISADFIYKVSNGIIITTNNTVTILDLKAIKKYLKNICNLDLIKSSHLSISKLYLKIVRLPHNLDQSNSVVSSELIKKVIKEMDIFNNIILVSKPHIIKAFFKFDMVVIWIDIWDLQSGAKAKSIIN